MMLEPPIVYTFHFFSFSSTTMHRGCPVGFGEFAAHITEVAAAKRMALPLSVRGSTAGCPTYMTRIFCEKA